MIELIKRYKNILLLVTVVVLLSVAYTILFRDDEGGELLNTEEPQGSAAAVEIELLGLLIDFKEIELDDAIFSDPAFKSLRDFSQELTPLPIGRANPFAPFGVGNFPTGGE